MKEHKFRSSLPEELKEDIRKYENNPNCPCNMNFYRKVLKHGAKQLQEFYPGKEIVNADTLPVLQENSFTVINCHIDQLEPKLKLLGPGRKFITVGRFEDQVTVIVNELDFDQ